MPRVLRQNTAAVLADVGAAGAPDPDAVVATVGPDGKVQLGRIDLPPAAVGEPEDPAVESLADDTSTAEGVDPDENETS